MPKLVKPILFSTHHGVPPEALDQAGLFDPVLNVDTKLFVDPLLIRTTSHDRVRADGFARLRAQFDYIVRLVDKSQTQGDAAWKGAYNILNLNERSETGLGYGGADVRGSSRPPSLRHQILRTAKEIITLGESDPEIISLMGLFEEGVGPDTLSDMATNMMLPVLAEVTAEFSLSNGLATVPFGEEFRNQSLPVNPYNIDRLTGSPRPIILVPRDVLRDLPLAADWADVSRVVFENDKLRREVNRMVGNLAKATISEKKRALRAAALRSLEHIRDILDSVRNSADHYDANEDVFGYYAFRKVLGAELGQFKRQIEPAADGSVEEVYRIAMAAVSVFRQLVENNNLWELLWNDRRPRRERAAQLLFFAVADMFCRANDVDVSPETNVGGGPVDFKFSKGRSSRVLVEIKMSSGKVVSGYETQLEIYRAAAEAREAIFMVVEVGPWGQKRRLIEKLREQRIAAGQPASRIEVVDGRRKQSASRARLV